MVLRLATATGLQHLTPLPLHHCSSSSSSSSPVPHNSTRNAVIVAVAVTIAVVVAVAVALSRSLSLCWQDRVALVGPRALSVCKYVQANIHIYIRIHSRTYACMHVCVYACVALTLFATAITLCVPTSLHLSPTAQPRVSLLFSPLFVCTAISTSMRAHACVCERARACVGEKLAQMCACERSIGACVRV